MKAEIPWVLRSGSLEAMQMAMSACEPLVVKVLLPFRIQSSPSRTAVVRVPPASLPASGSVRLQAPRASPAASGTRYLAFCASVPCS